MSAVIASFHPFALSKRLLHLRNWWLGLFASLLLFTPVHTASGLAYGAASVSGNLNGPLGNLAYTPLPDGRWTKDLTLPSGSHTLSVSAAHPLGRYTNTAVSSFSVQSASGTTNTYDGAGFVVQRRTGDLGRLGGSG